MTRSLAIVAAIILAQEAARAEDKWSIEARSGWTMLGGARPTGGLTLGLAGRYSSGDRWGWHLGLTADAIGVGGDGHWLGVIAGPEAGLWLRGGSFAGVLSATVPYGRLATCNDWGLCLRYWGIYPGGTCRAQYAPSESFAIGGDVAVLYVNTLGWEGLAVSIRAVGTVSF